MQGRHGSASRSVTRRGRYRAGGSISAPRAIAARQHQQTRRHQHGKDERPHNASASASCLFAASRSIVLSLHRAASVWCCRRKLGGPLVISGTLAFEPDAVVVGVDIFADRVALLADQLLKSGGARAARARAALSRITRASAHNARAFILHNAHRFRAPAAQRRCQPSAHGSALKKWDRHGQYHMRRERNATAKTLACAGGDVSVSSMVVGGPRWRLSLRAGMVLRWWQCRYSHGSLPSLTSLSGRRRRRGRQACDRLVRTARPNNIASSAKRHV